MAQDVAKGYRGSGCIAYGSGLRVKGLSFIVQGLEALT